MQINRTNNSISPNFKSKIPVRLLIDGKPSVDQKNVKMAMRQLTDMLFKYKGDQETVRLSRQMFIHYDKDFHMPNPGEDVWTIIRKKFIDGVSYIFTGKHAKELDNIARKIGSAKHKGLENYGTTKTFEAGAHTKAYFGKMQDFINNNKKDVLKDANGEDLILTISTKSSGKYGKRSFKLLIDYIDFDPIKDILKTQNQVKKTPTKTLSKTIVDKQLELFK